MIHAPRSRSFLLVAWIVLLAIGTLCQITIKLAGVDTGPFDFSLQAFAAAAASPWLWAAVACYVGEFLVWMLILRHSSLSSAFPTGAIVLIALMFASRFMFDEPLGWSKVVGSAMIVIGVLMLGPDQPMPTAPVGGSEPDAGTAHDESCADSPGRGNLKPFAERTDS